MSVAASWEKIRRIRRRFTKGTPWVLFPKTESGAHPVSTDALGLNAQALQILVEHYGPNPVHVGPLEKQARHDRAS